ncbi:YusW family protein [Planococcus dechangensis]|uniref:YusW family protein n=1 Tax=Planococcus dechangensis TaxID=1176255 RepID=A0ABV9MDF5_9BACL
MIRNKKMIVTALLMSSTLALAACGSDDEVTQPVTDDAPTETEAPEEESTEDASPSGGVSNDDDVGGETFGFTELSVDVDMPDEDDAIDISYEEDRDSVEAEYENKIDGVDLSGDDAMNEIQDALSQLDITADTPDDEVISQVVEAFGIDAGYKKIEVEVTYPDGTDKDYEHTNE